MIRHLASLLVFFSQFSFAEPAVDLDRLSIEQAIRIAIDRNHDLRLSKIAVNNALAAKLMASQGPNPTLTVQTFNINSKVGFRGGSLRDKNVDSTFRVDQLIERGGKLELRVENSTYLEDAAHNDLHDVLRQLRVSVSQSYYDLLAGEEKLSITRQTALLFDSTVVAAQKRLKAGDIANSDVARLQVDALRAQNDVAQAGADLFRVRQALAGTLGQAAYAEQIKLIDTWPVTQVTTSALSENLIEQRPDVLAAKARLNASVAAQKLALAARTRDISVGLQYEHYPITKVNPQGSGNSYGVAIQIPLFVRHQFEGEIRVAESAVDTAQENLEKTRDIARIDLMKNWEDARTAFERIKRYDENVLPAAKKSADAAEFAFKHGALGVMDVLDIRRTYRATQLDALAARAEYAKSLAAWQAAISEANIP